jgi:serine/threonine protein kinase/tetratricopeptide (TPR) repeat protein
MPGFQLSDWDDVGELVERALEMPASAREQWLREECGSDEDRLRRAQQVLAAAEQARSFLERPAADLAPSLIADVTVATDEALTHVGAYRILGLIGRGGMGEVYLAERSDEEFQRRVAVKVVRSGIGSDLVARFLSERQVLASFDHPHIAQLHDGGVTPDGRPYLVMEYVDGKPLDVYANEHTLTVDQRLELFLQVCDAVDRAHRRLVVHRDLKPANILVTREGQVKLLDFGVAKLLDLDATTSKSPVTRVGVRIMTPEYSSPEQFLGEPTTTATDIYSLGVILYELLAGRRPFGDGVADLAALERSVLTGDIPPPSSVCRDAATSRALRGDLDNIALTALRREPDRRYRSVFALRDDIERHRSGLPVSARPMTVRYRTTKFVRRHRVAVAAAAVVVAAAVAGTTATLLQARAAARQGQRAAQIRDFLVSVFENSDPDQSRGETVTARDLLDRGSERIHRELAADPVLRADMLGVLGNLYLQLGVFERARTHLEESLALHRSSGAPPATLVASLSSLASVSDEQGRTDQAERLLREALTLARSAGGTLRAAEAGVLSDLAAVHRSRGKFDMSESDARAALEIRRALGDDPGLVDTLNVLGLTLQDAGRAADAIVALNESSSIAKRLYGDVHTKTNLAACNLAVARRSAGQLDAALEGFRSCVDIRRRLLGNEHPHVGLVLNEMALTYSERNEYPDAERLFIEALAVQRKAYGERHREVAATLNNLAILAFQRSRYDEAAARFRELTAVWQSLLGPSHPDSLTSLNNLGMTLRTAGHFAEAQEVLEQVLKGRAEALGRDHPEVAATMVNLAGVLRRRSNFARAHALIDDALPIYDRAYPDGHLLIGIALVELGHVQLGEGSSTEALAAFDRAIVIRTKVFGATHLQTASARIGRGQALAESGWTAEARMVIQSAIDDMNAQNHSGSQTMREAVAALAAMNGKR